MGRAAITRGACRTTYAAGVESGRYLILFYDYVADVMERRGEHRPAHLDHVGAYKRDGRVAAAGALGDPPTGAAIVFRTESEEEIRAFVEADPYFIAGLVTSWRVVLWNVVV
jgi:uncharacterized protein YciI